MSDFIGTEPIGDAPGDFGQPYPQIDRDVVISGVFADDTSDIFGFIAPASGVAAFTLSQLSDDLDLAIFDAQQNLIGGSFGAGTSNEVIRIALVRGELYYLDVEGFMGASSGYRLTLDFAAVPQITGTTGADTLSGTAKSEDLNGLEGDDLLVGGTGYDMAVYRDPASGFLLGESGGQVLVRDTEPGDHDEGLDRLSGIEALRFSDRTWRLELPASQGAPLLRGTVADELIQVGGGGTLIVDGAGGVDVAVFRGQARDYAFELRDRTVVVSDALGSDGDDGTRLLRNFEILRFADRDLVVTGGEFRVNTTVVDSQAASVVAGQSGGGYTVAWTQVSTAGSELRYQCFSAGGVKLGAERNIPADTGSQDGLPSIAGTADGGFAMAWTREVNGISDVVFARFSGDGSIIGNPLQVDAVTGGDEGLTAIAELADGKLVIAWSRANLDAQDWTVRVWVFDVTGTAVAATQELSTAVPGFSLAPSVVVLADGRFVVCWANLDTQFRAHSLAQVFAADGATLTPVFEVTDASDPVDGVFTGIDILDPTAVANFALLCAPRIAAMPDGGFAVLAQRFSAGVGTLQLARFGADGSPQGSTTVANAAVSSDLIVLGDGTLVATWSKAGDSLLGADIDIYQQRFGTDGVPKGVATRVNSSTTAVQLLPDSAVLAGGGYLVTWTSEGQDLGDLGIYAQQYQQNGDVVRIEVRGTDGDDVLFYIGSEPMRAVGLGGNDLYLVERSGDQTIEAAGAGTDTVKAVLDWTLAANVENLQLSGGAIAGTGNALANDVRGTEAANRLVGGAGDDTLDGSAGEDTLQGGDGNDYYYVDNDKDVVDEPAPVGPGSATTPGSNIDTVESTVSYALAANIENLILKAGSAAVTGLGNDTSANRITGNANNNVLLGLGLDDTLVGGLGDDTLNGGSGNDVMSGEAGNDTYVVNSPADIVNELIGEGTDTVQASVSYTLAANVEAIVLTGADAIAATCNALANLVKGNAAANRLMGAAGRDTLEGGSGNDTLDGGVGSDRLLGGAGDDVYVVRTGDKVVEDAGAGTDTVRSSTDWTLAPNVESLILVGTVATQGVGNGLANTLIGSAGANALAGLAGNDTLRGGEGSDTLSGGLGRDVLTGGAGADRFLFDTAAGLSGADLVGDFVRGVDRIILDDDVYTAFTGAGVVDPIRFASGAGLTRAPNTDVRLVYDTTTGILYYDADGLGGAVGPLRVSEFTSNGLHPALGAADFLIVG